MLVRFILAAALAPASAAQTPPVTVPAVSPEEIAAAKARADQIIADADAASLFANTTTGGVAHVTHLASGMVCLFGREGADRIHIFPTGAGGMPRGDDVGCVSTDERSGTEITTYASRFRPLPDAATVLRVTENAIRQRWPDARPYEGQLVDMTVQGAAVPERSAFVIENGDDRYLTMTLIAHVGDWSYKVRATGPLDEAQEVGFHAALAMANIQMNLKAD